MTLQAHEQLVAALLEALPDAKAVRTHISTVILNGDVVYKLKKPVDFGFLDYSTLQKRHHCCLEELRSNRRFAAPLYLGIVTITGTPEEPVIEGEEEVIDYAVKMRRFDEAQQLDHVAERGGLAPEAMDVVAATIADFHRDAEVAEAGEEYGTPERVLAPMLENFALLERLLDDEGSLAVLEDLRAWTLETHARLKPLLKRRKAQGKVRECHGDMHLHNMAYFEGELLLFDAIEFNPFLSHIDVISDLAFLLMDLEYRGLRACSHRLLSAYLEWTGDYESVGTLNLYKSYRALVRAKVAALQLDQTPDADAQAALYGEIGRYIALAQSYTGRPKPFLAIMHGCSGSGKSVAALQAVERFGALRIRSDVERRRLFPDGEEGRYGAEATEATYARLADLARGAVLEHRSVVVDAAFLKRWQRKRFETLARECGVRWCILDMACDVSLSRARVEARLKEGSDPSEADTEVLRLQLAAAEPLEAGERACARRIDGTTHEGTAVDLVKALG